VFTDVPGRPPARSGSGGGSGSRASPPHDRREGGGIDADGGARDGDRHRDLELAQQPRAGEQAATGGKRGATREQAGILTRPSSRQQASARVPDGGRGRRGAYCTGNTTSAPTSSSGRACRRE
jgi:hypothetical protein